jgi:GR25 family glycosyltransferase involved in LPS biosynthesis
MWPMSGEPLDILPSKCPLGPHCKKVSITKGQKWVLVALGLYFLVRTVGQTEPPFFASPPIDCARIIYGNGSQYLARARAELARIGFPDASLQMEVLDRASHKRGCHNGHVRAHRWAVNNGCRASLIVEDDVVFADDLTEAWDAINRLLATPERWDALFLGYTALRIDAANTSGIVYLEKPMLMHATIFSHDTSRRIAEMPPWRAARKDLSVTDAYDVHLWYSGVLRPERTFGVYPAVAGQRPSQSASHSKDKNFVLNWGKSLPGMRFVNALAYGRCANIYQWAASAANWLEWVRLIENGDDWRATSRVFTCSQQRRG